MAKLMWDQTAEKIYETGTDHGVLYVQQNDGSYGEGIAWNGLTAVSEAPEGAEETALYADNIKYLSIMSAEEFKATIEAYTYPDEFGVCDGSAEVAPGVLLGQQGRQPFGFTYRTLVGNDVQGNDFGYKLHIVYNAKAMPSEKAYATVNDSPEAITFSWEVSTTKVDVEGYKPTASMTFDSTKVDPAKMAALEELLYGNDTDDAALPLPAEVIALMTAP